MTRGNKSMEVDVIDGSNYSTPSKEPVQGPVLGGSSGSASAMTRGNTSMEVDVLDGSNYPTPSKALVPVPVLEGSTGEGWPYAPEDWPQPGDVWRWKVGNRKTATGHWVDRYLYLPVRLQKPGCKAFPSRLRVKEYVKKEFPGADIDAFFSSFIWKVPCADDTPKKADGERTPRNVRPSSKPKILNGCRAGNEMCKPNKYNLPLGPCDICCTEPAFCRDCCCILCSRTIDCAYGGYSFIRCEAIVNENYVCGHAGHIECALRCFMGGTVGGSINLDVEYYCRHCDNRMSIMPHVTKLIETCKSLDSREEIAKNLNLGLCILRNSKKSRAKDMRNHIENIMTKLRDGIRLEEIWKVEDGMSAITGDMSQLEDEVIMLRAGDIATNKSTSDSTNEVGSSHGNQTFEGNAQRELYITSDHGNLSVKLEDEIDQVLQELRKAQESEYAIAEQKLYAQKDFLLSLYRQLEVDRSELVKPTSLLNSGNHDALLTNVVNRVDQIKHAENKLRDMMEVARGFGQTSKSVLKEHFGLPKK